MFNNARRINASKTLTCPRLCTRLCTRMHKCVQDFAQGRKNAAKPFQGFAKWRKNASIFSKALQKDAKMRPFCKDAKMRPFCKDARKRPNAKMRPFCKDAKIASKDTKMRLLASNWIRTPLYLSTDGVWGAGHLWVYIGENIISRNRIASWNSLFFSNTGPGCNDGYWWVFIYTIDML